MTANGLLSIDRHAPPWMVWSWAARDMTLAARTGQAGTLTRATRNRWVQDANGIYHEAVDHAPASAHYFDTVSGLYKAGGLSIHNGAQEICTRSSDVSNAAFAWNNSGRFTFSDAPSRFGGHVAKRAVNDNTIASVGRNFAIGTPGAVTRTAWLLIENVDATVCDVGLLSGTDAFVSGVRAQFTFGTGVVTVAAGAGVVTARKVSPTVWLITASRTCVAGHAMSGIYYLTGTAQNDDTTICHGAGVVDAKHAVLIPTVGAALTVNADVLKWLLAVTPAQLAETGFTFYESYIVDRHLEALTMDCSCVGENDVGGNNALLVSMDGASNRFAARWQTPSGNVSSTVAPAGLATAYAPGARIQRAVQVTPTGAAQVFAKVNGGALQTGAATAAVGYPVAWDVAEVNLADTVTAERKGHRLQQCAGLALGLRSLDDMDEVCA